MPFVRTPEPTARCLSASITIAVTNTKLAPSSSQPVTPWSVDTPEHVAEQLGIVETLSSQPYWSDNDLDPRRQLTKF